MKWWDRMPSLSFLMPMILVFWMVKFMPTFSLSSFTFIKRLFSSSSLSTIRVVSSAYLKLLVFFLAFLILACASCSPAFFMMYSAYKLNKTIYSLNALFSLFGTSHYSIFSSNCCFLTCTQISQETGQVVCYSHLFKNFPLYVWATQSKALA